MDKRRRYPKQLGKSKGNQEVDERSVGNEVSGFHGDWFYKGG